MAKAEEISLRSCKEKYRKAGITIRNKTAYWTVFYKNKRYARVEKDRGFDILGRICALAAVSDAAQYPRLDSATAAI